jgi:hypothetical protein
LSGGKISRTPCLIDQRFVLFQVDKIRLCREVATNIQSFGSED